MRMSCRTTCTYETLGAAAGRTASACTRPEEHGVADPERLTLSGHVLLAEDNLVNQEVTQSMLAMLGYTVLIAHNGREALAVIEVESVDLVLMDCQMPEVDGFEATAAIRDRWRGQGRRLPIVALTANAVAGDRERCLAQLEQLGRNGQGTSDIRP